MSEQESTDSTVGNTFDVEFLDGGTIEEILRDCAPADYYEIQNALGSAGAEEDLAETHKSILGILTKICSLHFEPGSRNEPFTPSIQLGDRRSFALDDLTPSDLTFLEVAASRITRPDLRGRLWDILWLRRRNLGVRTALSAIEAYSAIGLPTAGTAISSPVIDCWDRALSIARMIRGAGVAVIQPLEAVISGSLSDSLDNAYSLSRELSAISIRYGLDLEKCEARAQAFNVLADSSCADGQHFMEREFLKAASLWEARHERGAAYWDIAHRIAASHECDADQEMESINPAYIRVATFLEQAVQYYRLIPRQFRAVGFDLRLAELRQRLAAAGSRAVEEMSLIQSDPIDLSEMAGEAKARVAGKPVLEALFGLISLFPIPTREELLNTERELMAAGSLSSLFPRATLHEDGRVIAKVPAADAINEEDVILTRAIENYSRRIDLVVRGAIVPGLEAFNKDHCIRERELLPFVGESAAVPPGREAFFAKGLAAGFDWDFMSSSHLLMPQLEAFLRYHIKGRGGDTTVLSPEGIHTEASLGTLLEMEEATDILGPSLTFLFGALFVSPHGPNFRNVQAHGLIGETTAGGVYSVFTWWLSLRLVVLPFWASGKKAGSGKSDG